MSSDSDDESSATSVDVRQIGPLDYYVPDELGDDCPLARILASAPSDAYQRRNAAGEMLYIKYNGSLISKTIINGRVDTSVKNIQYNIQARVAYGNIERADPDWLHIDDTFRVSAALQSDIEHASIRNAALPRTFRTMCLGGVVERLARGIALYSMYNQLDGVVLRGGGNLEVRGIAAATDNIAVSPGAVFVTRRADETIRPATDYALMSAINGEGGVAYSDLVTIDGNHVVQLGGYTGAVLAQGCHEALVRLGRMYIQCGQGPSFAYAVVRGMCKTITLTSHCDEGGYVRRVLRRGVYAQPYGAVLLNRTETEYTGLPSPGGGIASYRKLVHSIILGAMGGVVNSDPMVQIGNRHYPTSISLGGGDTDDPGIQPAAALTDNELMIMQTNWATVAKDWAVNYIYYLGRLFGAPGSTTLGVQALCACADDTIRTQDDHLRRRTALAFYMVEATSITPFWDPMLPAMKYQCGALVENGGERSVPFFVNAKVESDMGTNRTSILYEGHFMRRHGGLVHLTGHRQNGMANIKLYSGMPDRFAFVGNAGAMAPRIIAGNGLNTYQWGRLHNMIVAPGEFTDMNEITRLLIEHITVADQNRPWELDNAHTPMRTEILQDVYYTCSRPATQPGIHPLVADVREIVRARSAACAALHTAAQRYCAPDRAWGATIRPMLGIPMNAYSNISIDDPLTELLSGDPAGVRVCDPDVVRHIEPSANPSVNIEPPVRVNATIVPLVIHNIADRGRRAPRAGQLQQAGGQPPQHGVNQGLQPAPNLGVVQPAAAPGQPLP